MTEFTVLQLMRDTFWLCLVLTTPILVLGMVIGVLISILQTATSIQEQSLSTVPKLIITVIGIIGMSRWMLQLMINFTTQLLSTLSSYANI